MVSAVPHRNGHHRAQRPLLEVRDLAVHFPFVQGSVFRRRKGVVRAVDGVSFTVAPGETFGLVGESGCGKSTTARAILNLVKPTAGLVEFDGIAIEGLSQRTMRPVRQHMQMVFQDPFASLNPRMTVGRIIGEPMHIFQLHARRRRQLEVMRLMDLVGLDPRLINRYPHEFSGGQRQRIGIARALAAQPRLIICDEPVSALDVSVQAQILNLLADLQRELGLTYVFIAHDLAVVRQISHRIGVMYLGRIVEVAEADTLCRHPRHPYTQALLSAVPIPDPAREAERRPIPLSGEPPSPEQLPIGCPFAGRCPKAELTCLEYPPQLDGVHHQVACFFAD